MPNPLTVVIFGASGDLTARKLIPALYHLYHKKRLPEAARVVGVARSAFTDEAFRQTMTTKVRDFIRAAGEHFNETTWNEFVQRLHYVSTDATAPGGLKPLADWFHAHGGSGPSDRLFYCSVSPELYPTIAANLAEAGMNNDDNGFRRVIIEKPFGHDLQTAKALNHSLHKYFREDQLYRIDHYLGKETVQNILIFRFANTLFEPIWNNQYIDHVQITVSESVLVGRRAGYYDGSGVLRDMFQSHILQVMAMVAMEAPSRYSADALRNEKMKVLDAVTLATTERTTRSAGLRSTSFVRPVIGDQLVVGQYEGYRQEPGVKPGSKTPTFSAVKLHVDNWRWKGVPFYLRSGKGMSKRYSEVVVQFFCPPHLMFPLPPGEVLQCNRLALVLQPNEGIRINFQTKAPDTDGVVLKAADLQFHYKDTYGTGALPEAYEILLLDAIQGDAALFMRSDEIERAWEIMDPLIALSEAESSPLPPEYPVGSYGPAAAEQMMTEVGRYWQNS